MIIYLPFPSNLLPVLHIPKFIYYERYVLTHIVSDRDLRSSIRDFWYTKTDDVLYTLTAVSRFCYRLGISGRKFNVMSFITWYRRLESKSWSMFEQSKLNFLFIAFWVFVRLYHHRSLQISPSLGILITPRQ